MLVSKKQAYNPYKSRESMKQILMTGASLFGFLIVVSGVSSWIYVRDGATNVAPLYASDWQVRTVTGNGEAGYFDGNGANAILCSPTAMVYDGSSLIFTDSCSHTIRRLYSNGTVSLVAGVAFKNGYIDGPASNALFNQPWGLALDSISKTLYITDTSNMIIRFSSCYCYRS